MPKGSKLLIYAAFAVLLAGCGSSRLQMKLPVDQIPEEAETAIVISSLNADQLFSNVQDSLIHSGYMIDQSNEQLYALSTRSRNMGNNKQMRMSFLIEPLKNQNSRMTVRAEWRSIPNPEELSDDQDASEIEMIGWQSAVWSDPIASKRAFGYLIKFIHKLPHENITYN